MTGSGTQADPYVIGDVNDLQDMNLDLTAYYELGQDIDASRPEWSWPSQIRRPSGDLASSGTWTVFPAAPATKWDKVCEEVEDEDATYITGVSNNAQAIFSFPSFNIPATAKNIGLAISAFVRNDGSAFSSIKFWIRVNGVDFPGDSYLIKGPNYAQWDEAWLTNPATGAAWEVDDINGVGANPLQAFGISCPDATPDVLITQIYATVSCVGFEPVGTWESGHPELAFSGSFDGKGHIIKNLFIDRHPPLWGNFQALFGYTLNSGEIKNVGLVDCNIGGFEWVGALIGFHDTFAPDGKISNCYATGTIRGLVGVGGLLGYNGASVEDCWSSCEIICNAGTVADVEEVGGLIGLNDGNITSCYATGDMTATAGAGFDVWGIGDLIGDHCTGNVSKCFATGNISVNAGGEVYEIGGLFGESWGDEISQCFATGNISAVGGGSYVWGVGGFSGFNHASYGIRDCYARGNVYAEHPSDISGIAGFSGDHYARWGEEINNCYSTGEITVVGPFAYVGGFNGEEDYPGYINNCFWDTETSGMDTSNGGTGKTTAQMKREHTFTNWSFRIIWGIGSICNDRYPCLLHVTSSCRYVPQGGMSLLFEEPERRRGYGK